ncbi:MAG TPA: hypothetical protein VM008_20265 [Phycisphaerae bacterium]|nr:hypothetical protein [Phycisphaerae bacterium]
MTPSPQPDSTVEPASAPRRPFSVSVRRHAIMLLTLLTLLSSAVFLYSPHLQRTYDVQGRMLVSARPIDAIPDLQRLPEAAVQNLENVADDNAVRLTVDTIPSGKQINLAASASNRQLALGRLHLLADQLTTFIHHRVQELAAFRRSELSTQSEILAERERAIARQIETFRLAHRGILPDDPNSVLSQFEKLSARLDDKQQRQRIVSDQIKRLQDYIARRHAGAGQNLAPPPPIAPVAQDPPEVPASTGADPEVATLTAQLQLINDQIDDQLANKHRTEEHPYVRDLRSQQADIQKRLDAARQRLAAGKPPPAGIRMPAQPSSPASSDASLAAAQQVDLELQALQAENDSLEVDVHNLTAQRDVMQLDVDQVMPVRREYEKLTAQMNSTQKDMQSVAAQIDAFNHQFGNPDSSDNSTPLAAGPVDIAPLEFSSASALPIYPKLPMIYLIGLAGGVAAAWLVALLLHRLDRSLHSAGEAAAILDVPIIGAVSEIRTRSRMHVYRFWRGFLRPLVAVALVLLAIGSAFLCYRELSETDVAATTATQQPVASLFTFRFGDSRP